MLISSVDVPQPMPSDAARFGVATVGGRLAIDGPVPLADFLLTEGRMAMPLGPQSKTTKFYGGGYEVNRHRRAWADSVRVARLLYFSAVPPLPWTSHYKQAAAPGTRRDRVRLQTGQSRWAGTAGIPA